MFCPPITAPRRCAAPLRIPRAPVKRGLDLALGVPALVLAALPMAVIALLILARDGRPVLFRQTRIGMGGRPFVLLKFRTMSVAAAPGADAALVQTRRCDTRVTRIGRGLRRFSLDELPQLINVIAGEMSLVGPRPHAPGMRAGSKPLDEALPAYRVRHLVKPGLTGLAQINGQRGAIESLASLAERLDSDIRYIEAWSPALDLKILLRTPGAVLEGRNAY